MSENNAPSVGMSPERLPEPVRQEVVASLEAVRDTLTRIPVPVIKRNIDGIIERLNDFAVASPVTCAWRKLPISEQWQPDCQGDNFDGALFRDMLDAYKFCPYCGKPLSLTSDRTEGS